MQPRNRDVRKGGSPGREPRKLLSVRSALVFTLAVLAGLGGAILLYAAHRPAALAAFAAIGVMAVALKFFDWLTTRTSRGAGQGSLSRSTAGTANPMIRPTASTAGRILSHTSLTPGTGTVGRRPGAMTADPEVLVRQRNV